MSGSINPVYVERRSWATSGTLWRISPPAQPAQVAPDRVAPASAVLPDGCMDLIWLDDHLLVAGPDTRPKPAGAARDVVGLRFDPGIAPGLLYVPAGEFTDARVPLSDVWPAGVVRRWENRVHRLGPPAVLEQFAAEHEAGNERRGELLLVARLCRLDRSRAVMAEATGWSERTLHRRCLDAFGYGSKTLARVLRFQRAVALLRAGRAPAEVAAETGYADQAHLSREVSGLAGTSPARLAVGAASPADAQPGRSANRSIGLPSGSATTA